MSSSSSKTTRSKRNSILKIRQTTVDTTVDVVKQPKNRRRVSFHHEKTVKEYDKDKHELSATSPLKETVREAMSDFDSTKSNSTMMSIATPDRTTGDNQTMMLFRGMMSKGAEPISIHHETKDMSFSIIEDPAASAASGNETLELFAAAAAANASHVTIHSKTIDISMKMEESIDENGADNTMDIFGGPRRANQSIRTEANMTMDMDISHADTTLKGGEETEGQDDTMAIFGGSSSKKDDTLLADPPLDNTMDMFRKGTGGSQEKSRIDESVLMDITAVDYPISSQEQTMAMFKKLSQELDQSVVMTDATIVEDEEKKEEGGETASSSSSSTLLAHSSLHTASLIDQSSKSPRSMSAASSMALQETQSPSLDDTMAMFGMRDAKLDESCVPMDLTQLPPPSISPSTSLPLPPLSSSQQDPLFTSPTMNMFKRKGRADDEEEEEEGATDETMQMFTAKRSREDADESRVESQSTQASSQKDITLEDATMNMFAARKDLDESELYEKEAKETSMMEISVRTAVESADRSRITPTPTVPADTTFDVFPAGGADAAAAADSSQMDVTGVAANVTFDVVPNGGDQSKMDLTGMANDTMNIFGSKKEEEEDEKEKTIGGEEEKKEEAAGDGMREEEEEKKDEEEKGDGSEVMEEETPPVVYDEERRKARLSTVIEVSSHYTAASSQSMRQRVGSEDVSDSAILSRMDEEKEEDKGEVSKMEEEMKKEVIEEKSMRMEESMMMEASPSPSGNNTTFSFTKKSMLDETRLSDRSMMNITKSLADLQMERVDWMREGDGGEEVEGIIRRGADGLIEKIRDEIQRSESSVAELLPQVREEKGELMEKSIEKMNPSKVPHLRALFDWARREAQRELWEMRAAAAEELNEEMKKRMDEEEKELERAKEDIIWMNRLPQLKNDVAELEAETRMGRGMKREEIDGMIERSKEKEEEKERLMRELEMIKMENMRHSTQALMMLTDRCSAVDRSIREKMEEQQKNKRELRAYLTQMKNSFK